MPVIHADITKDVSELVKEELNEKNIDVEPEVVTHLNGSEDIGFEDFDDIVRNISFYLPKDTSSNNSANKPNYDEVGGSNKVSNSFVYFLQPP